MSEPNEAEELRLDLQDARLTLAEAHDAMRRIQQHLATLTSDRMAIADELVDARRTIGRVKTLAARWDEGYSEWDFMYALQLNEALKGDDDV